MSSVDFGMARHRRLDVRTWAAVLLALFTATIFLSALLVFSVQPVFARMVLPKLGGSPSVWAVSTCFFQAVLLAGYCYAHVVNRFLGQRTALLAHVAVLAAALLTLPIGLPATTPDPTEGDAYLWLIATLGMGVGLPFFAVSANAPLLQSWFARSGHPHAADPYFLYAASNLGSLLALLAYPFAIEPFLALPVQAKLWSHGFLLLLMAIAACGLLAQGRDGETSAAATEHASDTALPLVWAQRLAWIGLAAVPSGLLTAFTSYMSADLASAPLLWVMPLALYLGTFVMTFRERATVPHRVLLSVQPFLVGIVLLFVSVPITSNWVILLGSGTLAFLVTTLVAHRELFERRPEARHLTEFYMWMSVGGALGGMFAALIAPQIFRNIWEFPLLLAFGLACRPGALGGLRAADGSRDLWKLFAIGLVGIAVLGGVLRFGAVGQSPIPTTAFILGLTACAMLAGGQESRKLVYYALMVVGIFVLPSRMTFGTSERSFFGLHRIMTDESGTFRILENGTTMHGAERIKTAEGQPVATPVPATYYYPEGPLAMGLETARKTMAHDGGMTIGIVGLGSGSMACHAKAGDRWRFFEIDPVVVRIARDPQHFTYLSRCLPGNEVVTGDARLTLAKEAKPFDYLAIDAFSSDAVPMHLLTVEALRLYLSKLAPEGLLALHVSNRHLNLVSVVAATAGTLPGVKAVLAEDRFQTSTPDKLPSLVVYLSKSETTLAEVRKLRFAKPMPASDLTPWADDFGNILEALWKGPY